METQLRQFTNQSFIQFSSAPSHKSTNADVSSISRILETYFNEIQTFTLKKMQFKIMYHGGINYLRMHKPCVMKRLKQREC